MTTARLEAGRFGREDGGVRPVAFLIVVVGGLLEHVAATGEQGSLDRLASDRVHRARATELHHHSAALVRDQAQVPQEQMQVGVVAVAEKRLGVGGQDLGVQVPEDFDLVFPADAGEYGLDLGIAEGRVQVLGPLGWGSLRRPGRGVLDRPQSELLTQPGQAQLERQREGGRAAPRRGEHGNGVTALGLGRVRERSAPSAAPLSESSQISWASHDWRGVNALQRMADENDVALLKSTVCAGRLERDHHRA